jgi:hypothetical protein
MPIWPPQPTTVGVMAFIPVQALFGDTASTVAVNPTRCLGPRRQTNTDTFTAIAQCLPIVRLCRTCFRRELHNPRTRRSCPSNIPRPPSFPDITMGCTPCHRVPSLNRFRVRYPLPTSLSGIRLLLLPLLLRALASHRNSLLLRSALTLSHPPPTPIKRRRCTRTLPMDHSQVASVRLRRLLAASRASPVPSIQNLEV